MSTRYTLDQMPDQSPMEQLKAYISSNHGNFASDLVLCPGDLVDQAQTEALPQVWKELSTIAKLVGAPQVYASVGNHDLTSRGGRQKPNAALQLLREPHFPGTGRTDSAMYFAEDVLLTKRDNYRILNLNTCLYHQSTPRKTDRWQDLDKGYITQLSERELADELAASDDSTFNIVLAHHHFTQFDDPTVVDDGIYNGQYWLKWLFNNSKSRWLIIHGHKHVGSIEYVGTASKSSVVMSLGSFGALISNPDGHSAGTGRFVRNQVYHLHLECDDTNPYHMEGYYRAYSFVGNRWQESKVDDILPPRGGFGVVPDIRGISEKVAARFHASVKPGLDAVKLSEMFEPFYNELERVVPGDIKQLLDHLDREHGLFLDKQIADTYLVKR